MTRGLVSPTYAADDVAHESARRSAAHGHLGVDGGQARPRQRGRRWYRRRVLTDGPTGTRESSAPRPSARHRASVGRCATAHPG